MSDQPKKKLSKVDQTIKDGADFLHAIGAMDAAAHAKMTMRDVATAGQPVATQLSPADIRALRESANMSQAAFAYHLNLSSSYIAQLERGAKRPTGAALLLLNVIRRRGIEAILS